VVLLMLSGNAMTLSGRMTAVSEDDSRHVVESIGRRPCGALGWSVRLNDTGVCAASIIRGACHRNLSNAGAKLVCSAVGGRLCTQGEIARNVAQGTGCNLDQEHVWTASFCTIFTDSGVSHPGSIVRLGKWYDPESANSSLSFCASWSSGRASVRCCSEVGVSTSSTSTPEPYTETSTSPGPSTVTAQQSVPSMGTGTVLCNDVSHACAFWASRGLCNDTKLAPYVQTNCKGSCGLSCNRESGLAAQPAEQPRIYRISTARNGCSAAANLMPITSRASCETAARALGMLTDVAAQTNNTALPPGCYRLPTGVRRRLWFNYATSGTASPTRESLCISV